MPTKHNLLKVFSIIALLAMIFSNIQPSVAQAQGGGGGERRNVTIRGGDGVNRKINAKSGKVSFIGPETGHVLAAAAALSTSIRPQDPAMGLAKRFAPEFGIQNPERDLKAMKSHRGQDGRLTAKYQQTYQGIPVMGGELIVNTNDRGDLYSINGEVSPDLSLSMQPAIDSATAKETALQEVAKSYQKSAEDFIATEPALWIYDESLLKESTRPAELVWRMDVTAKDTAIPVRELVIVNAQSGDISLHFNQIDTEWTGEKKADDAPTATPEPPQPTEPPVATDVPESMLPPAATQGEQSTTEITAAQFANLTGNTWYVATAGNDSNSCTVAGSPCLTINGAISKAASSGDTIYVAIGTYTGSGTEVVLINKNLAISGGWNISFTNQDGVSTIDGQNSRSGITVSSTANLDHFIIENGQAYYGGGINNSGNLTVSDSFIRNNSVDYNGGGIFNSNSSAALILNSTIVENNWAAYGGGGGIRNGSGNVTLNNASVRNNSAYKGGGIENYGTAILNNSTISNNSTNIGYGGGIYQAQGSLTLNNSTLSDNSSTEGYGGGIYKYSGSLIVKNSTVSNNFGEEGGGIYGGGGVTLENSILSANIAEYGGPDCVGIFGSSGYNIIGNNSSCTFSSTTGDIVGTSANPIDPKLASLQDNGGPTFTHALIIGSPAIDAGNAATCFATDQRGVARPVGTRCDIGAYEGALAWNPPYRVSTYTAGNSISLPGSFLCNQSDPSCALGDSHAKSAHRYAIGIYNLYATQFSRDSIDKLGMTITSTVHYDVSYDNAYWSGSQMVYGDFFGYSLADDVAAHELTHGVTEYESDLLYYYQSGAINESLSDVFGEYYDQTNGLGNDSPAAKWLLGEDVSGLNALRSMRDPTGYAGDPDKMTSPSYFTGGDDNGGVHENSGVNNKAVYLMVDGDTFNGKTVTGIGWDKVGAIYYEANTNLLTSSADYSDLYYAVQQACTNLIGQKGITTADCVQVKNALDAVEMNHRQNLGNFDDPSFEYSYDIYPYWDQSSTNFGTPLCSTAYAECVTMSTTAKPRTGSAWAWFGGTSYAETASVWQTVYFPRGYPTLRLKFYLWIGRADAHSDANDKFMAQVDGVTVFTANATQKSTYSSYRQVVVDVSAFARNALHTVTFKSVTSGQVVNFNLDDVSLGDDGYTISGNVGVADAILQYVYNGPRTVMADGSGNYSLNVPYNWSGSVTPYKSEYTFTPASKSYSNLRVDQTAQNYTAQVCINCADVSVSIGVAPVGNYMVIPAPSTVGRYGDIVNGPVKVVSNTVGNIFASQRVIYRNSFNELMGYPANKFSTEYWFPWYDQVNMSTWILVGNPSTTQTAYVDIYIGGVKKNDTPYAIVPGGNVTPQFAGEVNGPVRVVSVTGSGTPTPINIFASERSLYGTSFNEVMGYPTEQFASEYWFPWYDQVNMRTWILVGNPSTTDTAYVDIYIAGTRRADTNNEVKTYSIPPGQNITPQFPGMVDGPVRVVSVTGSGTPSPINIFTSERSLYGTSFNEVMGYPTNQFTTDYYYPWYDNQGMRTWVLVGNPSTTQTAYVDIYIGGVKVNDTVGAVPYAIAPNSNITPTFNKNTGPVHVVSVTGTGTVSPLNIFTSERALYGPSFNEVMGYPGNQLTSEYWFTWYDNANMKTEIYIGKP